MQWTTKLVGVSYDGRQGIIANLNQRASVELEREPGNPYDANAVAVYADGQQIGYIGRGLAEKIAPEIDQGKRYYAEIAEITGGGMHQYYGVTIRVRDDVRENQGVLF